MNKNNNISIMTNIQPIPSIFNEGFSQYETISKLIYLVNDLINDMNIGSDELKDLKNKKMEVTDYVSDLIKRKLSSDGNFTGTWNGYTPSEVNETTGAMLEEHETELIKINSQINDIIEQKFYKILPKPYNGFNMYLPYNVEEFGTYQSIIDNAVRLGAKCINICIRLNMSTLSTETLTLSTTQSDLVNVVNYAKSKGLKVMIKPHINQNSYQVFINVSNSRNWLQSYSSLVLQAIDWVKNSVDIVSISNELDNQTNYNLDLWQTLINNVKVLNPNIKTTCAMTKREINTNIYLSFIDYIGVNLYIGIDGDLNTNIDIMKKNMYKNYSDNLNWIDIIHKKAQELNKPIFITEVGILPLLVSLKDPASWNYTTDYKLNNTILAVQTLYYEICLSIFTNDTSIEGVMIWSLADGFTPIGNLNAENTIKKYFRGEYNV